MVNENGSKVSMNTISLKTFLYHFCNCSRPDKKFCFILGAGASRASGIPTGSELVITWMDELKKMYPEYELKAWQEKEKISTAELASSYPKIYDKRFELNKKDGFAYLEKAMEGKEPSCGYSVLAQILEINIHSIVITTNFDSLIEDALFIYTHKKPLVIGHESLAGYITPLGRRPIIVKIHRDLFFSPKNSSEQTNELEADFKKNLGSIFRYYTPLVIGYGGNDGSLMHFLENLEEIEGGMLWFYQQKDGNPNSRIQKLVEKFKGFGIPIEGFDELMLQIGNELGLNPLDKTIIEIAQRRAEVYRQQIENLNKSKTQDKATKEALSGILSRRAKDWWNYELLASNENDPDKRNAIYLEGIKQFPQSVELLSNYAIFLNVVRKDYSRAEEYYGKAIDLNPKNVLMLKNYAVFLEEVRKEYDKAEDYYQKAIALNPENVDTLFDYIVFLKNIRKDYDRVEECYRKAINLDPKNITILKHYAIFLEEVRKEYDKAEEYYKKAIDIYPENSETLYDYAIFLNVIRKDYSKAEEYYRKSIELGSQSVGAFADYAFILKNVRKYDRAEVYYRKAIDLDPKNIKILKNYAIFLEEVRKEYDKAEEYYQKAIALNPENVDTLIDYIVFLKNIRKDYDRVEECYRKAINLDPKNITILKNYAIFLEEVRKEYDKAEEYYQKAIDLDPKNVETLKDYNIFLKNIPKDHS
jgi:protein O-mannosyl-transferase